MKFIFIQLAIFLSCCSTLNAQIVINEGTNRNYSAIVDEDGEYPDWVELYNTSSDTVSLYNYSLSDDPTTPGKWTFPNVNMAPGEYKTVFCSGKNRAPISGFKHVATSNGFNAVVGWNTHIFDTPFYWDGVSNILINVCSFSNTGYTTNSIFNQSATSFPSTVLGFQDGSDASCGFHFGSAVYQRPNMKLNEAIIGTGTIQNSPYDYPAPYGNWYWGAKNQMIILASELSAAGLSAGDITSLSFDVAATDPATVYTYIDFNMKLISDNAISAAFQTVDLNNNLHTNFKISKNGEIVYLYSPQQVLQSSLLVNAREVDNSVGSFPDATPNIALFEHATPSATNNQSAIFFGYEQAPTFDVSSGLYQLPFNVTITNPNPPGDQSEIYYTLDGSDPTPASAHYTGTPVYVFYSCILKARVFANGILPSPIAVSSYFLNVSHETPVLSVVTNPANLFGANGIFDNWWQDWERAAYVEYFDSTQQLVFSQNAGMQIDGGLGGSRANPQHSFRITLDHGVLGDGPIHYKVIPNRPDRTKYSNFYLRNGSNQYLTLPYKDATQVMSMCAETNNYYSAWRPISVYVNGSYYGLYELREKFDAEYFKTLEGADPDSTDILSASLWYGGSLRSLQGSLDTFYSRYNAFVALNPTDPNYWDKADKYFDMAYYNDYMIGQTWMGNVDWPGNNIKIYRSEKTGFRYRYCIIDQELAMAPNGWTDCYSDNVNYLLTQDPNNPHVNIFLRSIQNDRFRNYFINRFADVMNTSYRFERIGGIENSMFDQTVLEMQHEFARWGDQNNIPQQMNTFYNNHVVFNFQLSERTTQVRNHIQADFALPNQVDLVLDVKPEGAGKIHISTIQPEEYPWHGIYFNGVPIRIEAIPESGYHFLHWGGNGLIVDTLNAVFNDTLNTNLTNFTAYFAADASAVSDLGEKQDWSVFPNPASTELFLVHDSGGEQPELQCQVVDLSGRVVKEVSVLKNAPKTRIDIQSLPTAVYLLRLFDSSRQYGQFRFVKTL